MSSIVMAENTTEELSIHIIEKEDTKTNKRTDSYKLSETLFGELYTTNTLTALDIRAYHNEIERTLENIETKAAENFYVLDVNLEYPDEGLEFSYGLQKYLYNLCKEKDLDYWIVMGIIARESRFDNTVLGKSGDTVYYGFMQMDWNAVEYARQVMNDETLDPKDPYDNLMIGTTILRYCIDEVGSEQGGVFAYGVGVQGYKNAVATGVYTDSLTKKAYRYRDLLKAKERFNANTMKLPV